MYREILSVALLGFGLFQWPILIPSEYELAGTFEDNRFEGPFYFLPKRIAVAPNGDVYVASIYEDLIIYFDGKGKHLGEWGGPGEGPGRFREPVAVAVSGEDIVYVVDFGNCRIQYFTLEGKYLGSWGTAGKGPGEFNWPCCIAVGPDGDVFVSDRANRDIQRFSPTGDWLGRWTVKPWDPEPRRDFIDIEVGPDGTVYVGMGDGGNKLFTPAGEFKGDLETYGTGLSRRGAPGMVTFAVNGAACVCGDIGFRAYDPSGILTGVWYDDDASPFETPNNPDAWALGPDGTIYFLDRDCRITYFAPTGRPVIPLTRAQILIMFVTLELGALIPVLLYFAWQSRRKRI
jgi:hypothetical protein